jgi:hypothetical protein
VQYQHDRIPAHITRAVRNHPDTTLCDRLVSSVRCVGPFLSHLSPSRLLRLGSLQLSPLRGHRGKRRGFYRTNSSSM